MRRAATPRMFHLVARTQGGLPLFRTWCEARRLWHLIGGAAPGLHAVVLMPNHLHLLHPRDLRRSIAAALAGYARQRTWATGRPTTMFEPLPEAERLADATKVRRTVRYIHLNPCRARLAVDPLDWPFSTHRDAVGLALSPLRAMARDPSAFHAYVSSDPTVNVAGTELPFRNLGVPTIEQVLSAVSAVLRVEASRLLERGRARVLIVQTLARSCPDMSQSDLGASVGIRRHAVAAALTTTDPGVEVICRVVGDPRFALLQDGPLWDATVGRAGHLTLLRPRFGGIRG